jgi:hypothetical protein
VYRHFLSTKPTDAATHITINRPPDEWHVTHIVHACADEEMTFSRSRGCKKSHDFLWKMLAVGIEQDNEFNLRVAPANSANRP